MVTSVAPYKTETPPFATLASTTCHYRYGATLFKLLWPILQKTCCMISIISLAYQASRKPVLLMHLSFILNFLFLTFSHPSYGMNGIPWNHGLLISQWNSLPLFSKRFHVCKIFILTHTFTFPFVFLHFLRKRKILNCLNFFSPLLKKLPALFSPYTTLLQFFKPSAVVAALGGPMGIRSYVSGHLSPHLWCPACPTRVEANFQLCAPGFWKTPPITPIYTHTSH